MRAIVRVYAQKLETCLTSLEIPQLGSFGSASVNADISDAAVVAEGVGDFEDLLRQLSRWRHDDAVGTAFRFLELGDLRKRLDPRQKRNQKRRSFSGT